MDYTEILDKASRLEVISRDESIYIYKSATLPDLMSAANKARNLQTEKEYVGWIVDRNVNITNGCFSQCKFCNFCVKPGSSCEFITSIEAYRKKIDVLFQAGGNQLLLQGGMHPKLGLKFYIDLFSSLKKMYPKLKLHALGPAEVHFLASREKMNHKDVLIHLTNAGMDSLPGAGAEILSDRVRNKISPNKCNSEEWLNVMREAHKLNMVTSATMMFGHMETIEERIDHLLALRKVQNEKPKNTPGFVTFIPWPLMGKDTALLMEYPHITPVLSKEYIRMISLSRLVINNIPNLQASWLTVGKDVAQVCLHAGANDLGSIMIEENVVSSAGANYKMNQNTITEAIREAGFTPKRRDQAYKWVE